MRKSENEGYDDNDIGGMRLSAAADHLVVRNEDIFITDRFGRYTSLRPDMGRCVLGSWTVGLSRSQVSDGDSREAPALGGGCLPVGPPPI